MFPFRVTVCKLSKKVRFLQFCADLSKSRSKSVEAIYIYVSESSHYSLSENAKGSEPPFNEKGSEPPFMRY